MWDVDPPILARTPYEDKRAFLAGLLTRASLNPETESALRRSCVMNLLVRNDQTFAVPGVESARGGPRLMRLAWLGVTCVALMFSHAAAQTGPAPTKGKPGGCAGNEGKTTKTSTQTPCGAERTANSPTPGGAPADMQTAPGSADPSPRWVCAKPTATPPPLWHGGQIECTYFIRNEGRSNLNIKAKGG